MPDKKIVIKLSAECLYLVSQNMCQNLELVTQHQWVFMQIKTMKSLFWINMVFSTTSF